MTNEELIKDKVQAATQLLLEVMVLMPPTSLPAPRLQLIWDTENMPTVESPFPAFLELTKKKPLRARR